MAPPRHVAPIRSSRSLTRREGRRPTRPLVLIVCEGESEKEYFIAMRAALRFSATEIVIPTKTDGSAPISVVNYAEKKCGEPGGYDHAFCVFDRDGHESFDRARDKIRQLSARARLPLPLKEAISIPCFEVWVLLHFVQSDAPFPNCNGVIRRIKDDGHLPDYEKADGKLFELLKDRLDAAIANADWLEPRGRANNFNPYTSIHKLVRLLKELSAQVAA